MSVFRRVLQGGNRRPPVGDDQEIVLLVLGMRKVGKSTWIRSLTGDEAGPEICADDAAFCTVKCDIYRVEWNGVKFGLVDTPGMVTDGDTANTTLDPIKQFLDENPLITIHGVLFMRPGQHTRMYNYEVGIMWTLRGICGRSFRNVTVVLGYWFGRTPADDEHDLKGWAEVTYQWLPGARVRIWDEDNPGAFLSDFCAMKREGVLGTKTLLLEKELRGRYPEPLYTTAGMFGLIKSFGPDEENRTRAGWGRKLRLWIFLLRYGPPIPQARKPTA